MGSSEREKFTPPKYIAQLAKDTIGIGASQRYRKRHKSDPDRLGVNLSTGVFTISQAISPIVTRFAEGHPMIKEYGMSAALIAVFLDLGIDAYAILLAMNGDIGEGIAVKVLYNAGQNALLDITSKKSP